MSQLFYEIEFLEDSIDINGLQFSKSVRVVETLGQKKIREHYLGFLELEEIYQKIEKGEKIDYSRVYIKNFSLKEYRKSREIAEDEPVKIPWLSIKDSLFDCESITDFSKAEFQDGVSLKRCAYMHGTLDFTHTKFYGGQAVFSDSRFQSHQTTFQYAEFHTKEVHFENSNFDGSVVSFINALFKCEVVNFKRCNFNESKVEFHFAEFGDGLKTFEKMKFYGPVLDFRRVDFGNGKVDFRRSLIGKGHITFEESELTGGKLTFRLSKFEGGQLSFRRTNFGPGEANFDHIVFGCRRISFEGSTGNLISLRNCDIDSSLDLRIKSVHTIDLTASHLHAITDLSFLKPDALKFLVLTEVRNLGKIIIDWKKNNVEALIADQDCSDPEKADQFNIIKDNFTINGQYADEDHAYVNYKRYEHKTMLRQNLDKYKSAKPFIHIGYVLRSLVFDKMGLFATSPTRVLLSMIVVIFLFAFAYMIVFYLGHGELINSVDASDGLNIFDKSLYHSAITFFTIGYGDFYPTSFNRAISASEGWVGVFMMSYFTVAFVRKALR
ncbi:two pore domain potassium channel family protein [bacterium AH-315-C20]|nr:two pore domain potassium channel family protein [bacterium AH-315-C20]